MNRTDYEKEQRRVRERALARRTKELGERMKWLGDLLCDSQNKAGTRDKLIVEGLRVLLGSTRAKPLLDSDRETLAQHFKSSPFREDYLNSVSFDGNCLRLEGHFDMKALAQKLLWVGVEEHYRQVEDDSEEPTSRWGYDAGVEVAMRLLADMGTTGDELMDAVSAGAQAFVQREEEKLGL